MLTEARRTTDHTICHRVEYPGGWLFMMFPLDAEYVTCLHENGPGFECALSYALTGCIHCK